MILTFGAFVAIVFFSAANMYVGVLSLQRTLLAGAENTANIMGSGLVAAIRFEQPSLAHEKLKALTPDASYKNVCVHGTDGHVFAGFPDSSRCKPMQTLWNGIFKEGSVHSKGNLTVIKNIWSDGQVVGAIEVVRSKDSINQYLHEQLKAAMLIAAICLAICYLIASFLQKIISKPIVEIATRAELISIMHNFDQRLMHNSNDELGQVARAFNTVVGFMNTRNQELQHAYENVQKAHRLTLDKLEEIVQEFSDPMDAFTLYASASEKELLGPQFIQHRIHQKEVMESISEYQIRLSSISRISNIYSASIREPLSTVAIREYIAKYMNSLKSMLNDVHTEKLGLLSDLSLRLTIDVYKTAWEELFRMLSHLTLSMCEIVEFQPKLQFSLRSDLSELTFSIIAHQAKATKSNVTPLRLCDLDHPEHAELYGLNTIDDPDVANEFLDPNLLQRKDVKFILDTMSYIANANQIAFRHNFAPNHFSVYLGLSNVKCTELPQPYLKACQ
jgi:HAMP domain-containing protein